MADRAFVLFSTPGLKVISLSVNLINHTHHRYHFSPIVNRVRINTDEKIFSRNRRQYFVAKKYKETSEQFYGHYQ